MQFQNILLALLATALTTQALPQPVAEADNDTLLASEAVDVNIETLDNWSSAAPDYAKGVTVKLWNQNRGCNTVPAFKTVQIPYKSGCQKVRFGSIGSTLVVKNGLGKKCQMSVFNTPDCTAGNFYVVPAGVKNCWAQDVKSVKISCY